MQQILGRKARAVMAAAAAALIILGLAAPAALYGANLVPGLGCGTVSSGSMLPGLGPGDVIYFRDAGTGGPSEGDVVVFEAPGGVETVHRVARVDGSSGRLVTKGDANQEEDPYTVPADRVLGVVVGSISRQSAIGVTLDVLRDISGFLVGSGAMLALMAAVSGRRRGT